MFFDVGSVWAHKTLDLRVFIRKVTDEGVRTFHLGSKQALDNPLWRDIFRYTEWSTEELLANFDPILSATDRLLAGQDLQIGPVVSVVEVPQ